MSKEIISQIFRSLEASIHERLKVIEDLMMTSLNESKPQEFKPLEVTVENGERTVTVADDPRFAALSDQIVALTARLDSFVAKDRAPNTILLTSTLDVFPEEDEVQPSSPVEAEAEAEVEVPPEIEEEAEAEEEAEDEEAEEEEEELEEDFELVELEYKGTTYYRDEKTNKVYLPDDDGAIDPEQPLGIWNLQTKKIQRLS
jgi:hypothetical protein